MQSNRINKKVLKQLLKTIDNNFIVSRSTVFGYYNVSLSEAANIAFEDVEEIEISDLNEKLVGIFQIDEILSKYNLEDKNFIENIKYQDQFYDLENDLRRLNSFASKYITENNLKEELEERLIKAKNQSINYNRRLDEKRKSVSNSGYIYLIKSDLGYKIGKTKNLKQRDKLFSVKMPFDYQYEDKRKCNNYHQLELRLHNEFESKRINGEWFDLNESDVERIKTILDNNELKSSS